MKASINKEKEESGGERVRCEVTSQLGEMSPEVTVTCDPTALLFKE